VGRPLGRAGAAGRDRLRFRDRRALLEVALAPDTRVGEAYRERRFDVEGDLARVLCEVYRALGARPSHRPRFWNRGHSRRASRDNVHHHYDLGNDFYRLWLDEWLLYTCRFLPAARGLARGGSGREDGSRLPQAVAAPR
jgi:cyclopropane-fatty-acyl-phospholipid synthase